MDTLAQTLQGELDFSQESIRYLSRLGVALGLGMLIGLDREFRQKPAGLRTHMLVSLASASLTIMTLLVVQDTSIFGDTVRADPLRLMEAVVTGVAFLGAGAIIQSRGSVRGITTGASMWLAGSLGVACGFGYFTLAVLTAILGVLVLFVLGWIERQIQNSR